LNKTMVWIFVVEIARVQLFIMTFLGFKLLYDESDNTVFICGYIHDIKVFTQKILDGFQFYSRYYMPFADFGITNFALFSEHIRQFGIVWLNGSSSVFDRDFLIAN